MILYHVAEKLIRDIHILWFVYKFVKMHSVLIGLASERLMLLPSIIPQPFLYVVPLFSVHMRVLQTLLPPRGFKFSIGVCKSGMYVEGSCFY